MTKQEEKKSENGISQIVL